MPAYVFYGIMFIYLFSNSYLSAQTNVDWFVLADVKFEKKFSESLGYSYEEATFGDWVKQYDGKEISITGYVIPLDVMATTLALSANPNSTCFFCGAAGPETVLDLRLSPDVERRFRMDELVTFKGKLKLNRRNDRQFTYVLQNAEPL